MVFGYKMLTTPSIGHDYYVNDALATHMKYWKYQHDIDIVYTPAQQCVHRCPQTSGSSSMIIDYTGDPLSILQGSSHHNLLVVGLNCAEEECMLLIVVGKLRVLGTWQ